MANDEKVHAESAAYTYFGCELRSGAAKSIRPLTALLSRPRSNPMAGALKVNGIPTGWHADMLSWVGGPVRRRLARWGKVLEEIAAFEPELTNESDRDLRKRSLSLRYRRSPGSPSFEVFS